MIPTVALVGCAARKLDRRAPAHQLYTSALFRAALAYAEPRHDHVYIVSARHGLVALGQELDPYELKLQDLGGVRERDLWGERVIGQLVARHDHAPLVVTLLLGDSYARHLRGPLILRTSEAWRGRRWPERPKEPLAKLASGPRLIFLRSAT